MKPDTRHLPGAKPQETLPVGILLILAAGMLDAYTYVGYGGVFANAMTGNLVVMTVRMSGGDFRAAIPYLAPIAAYIFGVSVAHALKEKPLRAIFPHRARTSLAIEIAFLCVVAFLPRSVPNTLIVTGIAFVAALQATAFTRIGNFAFTSVTTSANLRHFAESFMASVVFREGEKAAREWHFFLVICLSFFIGAVSGAVATRWLGHAAVWLPIAALALALCLCMPWNRTMHQLMTED